MQQDPDLIARSAEELVGDLNPQQAEAVQYRGPALLIGAGAGSGKTRVLTRRIAWILTQFGAWPSQILAITFTNKAAAEMRERLEGLIGPVAQRMWVSTFHSACVRILRRDGQSIGLASGFSIYDTADCERLVKLIGADLNIDLKRYTPRAILSRISDYKNSLIGWQEQLKRYAPDYRPGQRGYQIGNFGDIEVLYSVIYAEYQHRLAMANAVDFDDLIGRTVELLRTQPQVADYYRHKFRYILVDEYQDTNHAQYELIRELAGVDAAGQVVPDDPDILPGNWASVYITDLGNGNNECLLNLDTGEFQPQPTTWFKDQAAPRCPIIWAADHGMLFLQYGEVYYTEKGIGPDGLPASYTVGRNEYGIISFDDYLAGSQDWVHVTLLGDDFA